MHLRSFSSGIKQLGAAIGVTSALAFLAAPLPAQAAPLRIEGAITMLPKGANWMVVCATQSPYQCRKVTLWNRTKVVTSTGKPAHLAVGEYVTVDTQGQFEKTFAMQVNVAPDRILRSLPGFKPAQTAKVQTGLMRLRGVRTVQLIPALGEVLLNYNTALTSPAVIERQAAKSHIKLALPE